MKHLRYFETEFNYNNYLNKGIDRPNVSFIKETKSLNYFQKLHKHNYSNDYLTFVALEDTTFSFTVNNVQYSIDGGQTWSTLTVGQNTETVLAGNKILWKNTNPIINNNDSGMGKFISTGKFNAEGNVMSLLFGDDFIGQTDLTGYNNAFTGLFNSSPNLISVQNLILSPKILSNKCYWGMFYMCTLLVDSPQIQAEQLAIRCYEGMFDGCSSLVTAPELPITALTRECYISMFKNCTSLTTAPELPATILQHRCYEHMFDGCTSLTTAPKLPATTLSGQCYGYMFTGCTALTTAPKLPATTLNDSCYLYMFNGCTSLTTAPELPATTLASYCYTNMFRNCTALTTAPELPATTLDNNCYTSMFDGCTSLTTAPELPAMTLAPHCYEYMFHYCTSLTTAPELLATTLSDFCYANMFDGCTSLTTAPELPAMTLAPHCYEYMFHHCTSLTTAPSILPAISLGYYCYQYMFNGCTSLTTAPELPATTLASYCYQYMFDGCTSLTTAPELPATTLSGQCYSNMFNGCTSLTTAPELLATTLSGQCYEHMFDGCTALTTAPELPATTLVYGCYQYMFKNCNKLTESPLLPAIKLQNNCYSYMFIGCSSLNKISAMFKTTPSDAYTLNWVNGVASIGTFIKHVNATWELNGTNGIPENWAVDTVQPEYDEEDEIIETIELPEGYTKVDYIASTATGGQYIDLGLQLWATSPISYKLDMSVLMIGKGKGNSNQSTLFGNNYEVKPWPGFVIRNNSNSNVEQDQYPSTVYGVNNTVTNILQEQTNLNVTTHNVTCTLFCGKNGSGTPWRFANARVYYAKIWSQGELVRNLWPCLNTDNIPGLYDVVNDVFYPSQGTEQFIYE